MASSHALAGHVTLVTGASRGIGRSIALTLAGEGAGLAHLLKITTWLSDMRHYDGFNEVRRAAFAGLATPPASTCVGGAQFTTTDVCIEIEGIAVLPGPA